MARAEMGVLATFTDDKDIQAAFQAYALAVGKVAYSWNYLHERLGELFATLTRADRSISLAVWHSSDSDRTQRNMFRAAVVAIKERGWPANFSRADLIWLVDRADEIAESRNNAVHAPCAFSLNEREMSASSGHSRARKLAGKKLLGEFAWCERYTEILSNFVQRIDSSITFPERVSWPDKPLLPTREQKSAPRVPQLHQSKKE